VSKETKSEAKPGTAGDTIVPPIFTSVMTTAAPANTEAAVETNAPGRADQRIASDRERAPERLNTAGLRRRYRHVRNIERGAREIVVVDRGRLPEGSEHLPGRTFEADESGADPGAGIDTGKTNRAVAVDVDLPLRAIAITVVVFNHSRPNGAPLKRDA
jgi:hypothetical protein